MSTLAWARSEARSATPQQILEQLDKLQMLTELGTSAFTASDLEPNRVRLLAAIARRSRTRHSSGGTRLCATRRSMRSAPSSSVDCPMRSSICSTRRWDTGTPVLGVSLGQRKLADAKATNEQVHLLSRLLEVLIDPSVPDEQVRARIFQTVARSRLEAAAAEAARLARPLDDNHFAELDRCYSWVRGFTPRLLDALTLNGDASARSLLDAIDVLRDLNRSGARSVPAGAPTGFVPARWRPYVIDKDGQIDRHQWETLPALRATRRAPSRPSDRRP